jgi:hypothetical protein
LGVEPHNFVLGYLWLQVEKLDEFCRKKKYTVENDTMGTNYLEGVEESTYQTLLTTGHTTTIGCEILSKSAGVSKPR